MVRVRWGAIAVLAIVLSASLPARAEDVRKRFTGRNADLVEAALAKALRKLRRATAFGPFVSAAGGLTSGEPTGEERASFGLGLFHFDIPVLPTSETVQGILRNRAAERFAAALAQLPAGGAAATEAEKASLAEQVWNDVQAEFLLEHRPRHFEKPGFAILLEVDHLFEIGAWEIGTILSYGIGPILFGAGPVVHIEDGTALYTHLEVSVPILISDGLRSPIVQPFVAGDVAATGRDERDDRVLIGARLVLDLL